MANFETHLSVAAAGSGLISIAYLGAEVATPEEAVGFWLAGTLGGIMPDIDADNSTSVKSIFNLIATLTALAVMVIKSDTCSIVDLWIAGALTFAVIRFPLLRIFYRFTAHRGIFHSIITGVFFWFLTTITCYHVFDLNSGLAWTSGFFLFIGFMIHLTLDEIFSVDMSGNKIKKSFGTALELFEYDNPKTSAAMIAVTIGLFFLTPGVDSVNDVLLNGHSFRSFSDSFWPKNGWLF